MPQYTYATPTFIVEVFSFFAYVQLFQMIFKMKIITHTVRAYYVLLLPGWFYDSVLL